MPSLAARVSDHWCAIEPHIYDRGRRGRAFEAMIYDFAVAAGADPSNILHRYHLEGDRMAPEWDLIVLPSSDAEKAVAIGAKTSLRERAYTDWSANWFGTHHGYRHDPVFRKQEPHAWFLAWEGKAAKRYVTCERSMQTVAHTAERMLRYGCDSAVHVHAVCDVQAMSDLANLIGKIS